MISLIDSFKDGSGTCINNRWYIAKPLNYSKDYYSLRDKLKGIFLILKNKAIAVQFAEDKENKNG